MMYYIFHSFLPWKIFSLSFFKGNTVKVWLAAWCTFDVVQGNGSLNGWNEWMSHHSLVSTAQITVNTHRFNHHHHLYQYIAITIIISFSLPCPGVWWRWCWLLCTSSSFHPIVVVLLLVTYFYYLYHGDHSTFYYLPHHHICSHL